MKSRLLKISIPAVLSLIVVGAAFAYFTSAGSGSGSADANGTRHAITLSAGTPSADLIPGGTADVALTLHNTNAYPVHVDSLSLDTDGITVDSGHPGCSASDVTYTTQSTGWTVPANDTLDLDLTGAVSLASSASDACQGARFTIHLKSGS